MVGNYTNIGINTGNKNFFIFIIKLVTPILKLIIFFKDKMLVDISITPHTTLICLKLKKKIINKNKHRIFFFQLYFPIFGRSPH